MRVHVCVSAIKGLPYEGTLCESRNTQQDLSLLSEAHRYRLRETQKKQKQVTEGEEKGKQRKNSTVSMKPKRGGEIHIEKYRDKQRDMWKEEVRFTVSTVSLTYCSEPLYSRSV